MLTIKQKTELANYVRIHNLKKVNVLSQGVTVQCGIYGKYIKRLIDIFVSAVALIVTLPANLIIGICTFFDVGRPIFFFQKRPGRNGKLFTIVKFRNMTNETDENGVLLPFTQRVTKFGKFVRKTSLDELLNFWSIFKGDMSLIGPRPLAEIYLTRYSDRHMMRHAVRPGLECPNLFNKGYSYGWHEQFENDIWYVNNVSFITDCKMVFCLFRMVFDKETRSQHASVGPGDFIGYDENGRAFGANDVPEKYLTILEERKVG